MSCMCGDSECVGAAEGTRTVDGRQESLAVLRTLWPEGKVLPEFAGPELLGYSVYAPLRDAMEWPKGFTRFAELLGVRFAVGDTYPHFMPAIKTVELPPPAFFASDSVAWHALFHECAHFVHHIEHGHFLKYIVAKRLGMLTELWERNWRAETEIIAELSAYFAMTRVGIIEDPIKTETFVRNWCGKLADPHIVEELLEMSFVIADKLVETYTEGMQSC